MNYYSIENEKNLQDININIIRLSCAVQLKVLLVAIKKEFREKFNSEQIATELKKEVIDVEEAIDFWVNLKIIKNFDQKFNNNNINLNSKNINIKQDIKKNNKNYILDRIKLDEEINYLLNEVETSLGRPLSGTDISVILNLKDGEGMPCNVILMLVRYCMQIGKASTRYIEKVGIDWAKKNKIS